MKAKKLITILILGAIIFPGCFLKSVHPLVQPDDAILMDGLEGRWESDDQRWTFLHDPSNFPELMETEAFVLEDDETFMDGQQVYMILFENLQDVSADTTILLGMVSKWSDNYFLDLSVMFRSLRNAGAEESFIDGHFQPVHSISKIKIEGGKLAIEFFEDAWIKGLIDNNRVRIKHEKVDGDVLVTASTSELQKFVAKYGDDDDAFDDPVKLARK